MLPSAVNAFFVNEVHSLYDYFQVTKHPTSDVVNIWFKKVRHIDPVDLKSTFEKIKDDFDNIPRNIPKAIKKTYFLIIQGRPQPFQIIEPIEPCEDCNGMGMFKVRKKGVDGLWYEPLYFCSRCRNWQNWSNDPAIDRISKTELEAMGVKFKPYNKVLSKSVVKNITGTSHAVNVIATDIGKDKALNPGQAKHGSRETPEEYK